MNANEPCRDDGLCSACADAPRCAACKEYLPEHEDDCDGEFVAAEREVAPRRCEIRALDNLGRQCDNVAVGIGAFSAQVCRMHGGE